MKHIVNLTRNELDYLDNSFFHARSFEIQGAYTSGMRSVVFRPEDKSYELMTYNKGTLRINESVLGQLHPQFQNYIYSVINQVPNLEGIVEIMQDS